MNTKPVRLVSERSGGDLRLILGRWCGLALLLLAGCAGTVEYREGREQIARGNMDAGLTKLREAHTKDPQNAEYRSAYFRHRELAINALLQQAAVAAEIGNFVAARHTYQRLTELDPGHPRIFAGLQRVAAAERHWRLLEEADSLAKSGRVDEAVDKTRAILSENPVHARAQSQLKQLMRLQADRSGRELGIHPKLKAAYRSPVTLSFTGASLQQVFESLKAASGLNYVFDKDVRGEARITISVANKPVEDVLRLILATHQLERRVLDEDTLLIFPSTPAKIAEYREMVVRTFYLSNAEAGKVANTLRTIAKAKDVVVDEKLNLVVVRDSAEVIRLAEKLIATLDIAEPEVMLELEVLEVSVSRLMEMGISWPSSVSASVAGAAGTPGQLTLNELRNRNAGLISLQTSDPLIAAQLRSQRSNANLLANPRIRVRNKQSAKILIGERVPVFTTTATANVGTFESVNYLDVGLKLDIEPTVSLDDEVSMKLALEVSNILETVTRPSGTQAYRLGTRNTSTMLRVRDGETNILAGLIQKDERQSNSGIPGLNELPVVSKLFGADRDTDTRTEIVLLVTPRIVRNVELPGLGQQEFLAGTDATIGAAPIQLGPSGLPARPPSLPLPATGPAVQPPTLPQPPSVRPPGSIPAPPPALTPPPLIPDSTGQPSGR